jgi:hypothetical protein
LLLGKATIPRWDLHPLNLTVLHSALTPMVHAASAKGS